MEVKCFVWCVAGGTSIRQSAPVVTPSGLVVTSRGRVLVTPLSRPQDHSWTAFTAPEYSHRRCLTDTQLEKVNIVVQYYVVYYL